MQWLQEHLTDSKGWDWAKAIQEAARFADIPIATLKRAKDVLPINSYREGKHWYWKLEDQEDQEDQGGQEGQDSQHCLNTGDIAA
jgi:hypothetical protein